LTSVALLASLQLALITPSPVFAGCGGVQVGFPHRHVAPGLPPLAVGDSSMLLALPNLTAEGFAVNAHGCRQFPEALTLLRGLRQARRLPHLVVVALGADGSVTTGDISATLEILGRHRMLVLVTPRELGGGSGSDATNVRAAGVQYPTRIKVLDWVTYSAGHGSWFQPDGLHLTFPGAVVFAHFLARALPLAAAPPASITLTAPGPTVKRVVVHPPKAWELLSHHADAVVLRTPGRCGYRVTLSASVVAAPSPGATGASGASGGSGASGASGGTGASGATGNDSTSVADSLIPAGARIGRSGATPAGEAPSAAWVTWSKPIAPALGGAWAAPEAASTSFLVIDAQGVASSTCPAGHTLGAQTALAAIFAGAQPS
jgi:hypothetical protein